MTNPAQLKYLDAMGIPVWVSRDIVVQDAPTDTIMDAPLAASSAESILQGLNEPVAQEVASPTIKDGKAVKAAPSQQALEKRTQNTSPTANEIARTSSHIVYASGSLQAEWMVIGESPDTNDERMNQPYAGELGVLLNNMLRAAGLENPSESAYRINVIRSSMQAIEPASMVELNQLLNDKIKEIKPQMIFIVGQLAAQNLLKSKEPLARLRGKSHKHPETNTHMVVSYYPSYLLSKPKDKRKAWEDLKLAMKLLNPSAE